MDLNGKTAKVIKFKPSIGRYRIKVLLVSSDDYEIVAVKRTNLRDADEALFAAPPPSPECAICLMPMPFGLVVATLQVCCGKTICAGCIMTDALVDPYRPCPFCRQPNPKNDEKLVELIRKRINSGNGDACVSLGGFYMEGFRGLPRDVNRGLEMWRRGAELGSVAAQYNVSLCYMDGQFNTERDMAKGVHFLEQAAKGGHVRARSNLGHFEATAATESINEEDRRRHIRRGIMHDLIAAKCGSDMSLERVKIGYRMGVATKGEFASALRGHKDSRDEMKSEARDRASAAYSTHASMANADRLQIPPNR